MAVAPSQPDNGQLDQRTKSILSYKNRIEGLSHEISKLVEAGEENIHVYDRKVISIVNCITNIGSLYEGERAFRIMKGVDVLQEWYFQFRTFDPNPSSLYAFLLKWLLRVNAIVYPSDKDRYWKSVFLDISALQGKMKALLTRD